MRRGTGALAALTLVLTIPLAGCGGGDEGRDEIARSATERPVIEVLDAGAEPRRVLSLEVEEGQRETTSMTLEQTIDYGTPTKMPPITLTFTTEVLEAGEDTIESEVVYGPPRVSRAGADSSLVSELESALRPLRGLSGRAVQSTNGEILEVDFDVPDDVPETMSTLIEQFSDQAAAATVPLLDDEVGVGARWAASTTLELNGVEVEQVATYTLDALDGEAYDISVQLEQAFQPGEANGVEITSGSGSATGRIRGVVGGLMPKKSVMSYQSTVTGQADGQSVDVRTTTEMRLRSGSS